MKIATRFLVPGLALACVGYALPSSAVLTHHWTFDNADVSGTGTFGDPFVVSDVVGSADATATGIDGGTNMMSGQAGVFGEAFSFMRDDVGNAGNNTLPGEPLDFETGVRTAVTGVAPAGAAERTIMLWFNYDGGPGQNKLFGYGGNNTDSDATTGEALDVGLEADGIRLRNFNGNMLYGEGFDFAADTDGLGTPGADAGWHHLAVRVNTGATTFNDLDIFLDGVKLSAQLVNGAPDADLDDTLAITDSAFGIGNIGYDHYLLNGFNGLIDEVRIYDNALTDQEIADLAEFPVLPGDTDGDGDIDDSDLGTAFSNYTGPLAPGTGGKTAADGDTDGDGDVDDSDLGTAFSGYTGPLSAPVPEPTSLALIGLGGLALVRRRRA
ncbi:MAG: LamG-like jellyroll fold domain-containing protein [Phycisphaeraceae bacterium]